MRAQNGPFALKKIFVGKTINIIFTYLLLPFIVQNFKKLLEGIQSYGGTSFWDQKAELPLMFFFLKNIIILCTSWPLWLWKL